MFSGADAPWHWLIVIIVAAVLFGGYKKLPEAARSLGRSLRIFKTEIKGMSDDDAARDAARAAAKAEIAAPTSDSAQRSDGSTVAGAPQPPPSESSERPVTTEPPRSTPEGQ